MCHDRAVPIDDLLKIAPWIATVVVTTCVLWLAQRLTTRLQRRLQAWRAARGESRAARLLRRAGYTIEHEQHTLTWPVSVGTDTLEIRLRADYVVSRNTKRFVAEVKTGRHVVSVRHGPTRRQLLEYRLAFAVDGVLLVNASAGTIERVEFPALYPGPIA